MIINKIKRTIGFYNEFNLKNDTKLRSIPFFLNKMSINYFIDKIEKMKWIIQIIKYKTYKNFV